MESSLAILQTLLDKLLSVFWVVVGWLKANRTSDVSVWAIAFTMNTWAASLGWVRFQLHGAIRKAIDESRAKAQQARLLERLTDWKGPDESSFRKIEKKFDTFLSKLELFDVKYPRLEMDLREPLLNGFPRFVLGFAAIVSLGCILFNKLYNWTLVVLLPFPAFFIYYSFKKRSVPRFIRRRYAKLENDFDKLENAPASTKSPKKSFKERLEALGSEKRSC